MSTAIDFLTTRRSVPAAFLDEPGPTSAEMRQILTAGIRVPDHGKLAPWRFVLIEGDRRREAGEALLKLRRDRGEQLSDEEVSAEQDRFTRAPSVIVVVSTAEIHPKIPEWEQWLSAGSVCMNLLNGAHALGFAAQWLTDWPVYDDEARRLLGLADHERPAGFIHIGTPSVAPRERPRPSPEDLTSRWPSTGGS